MKFLWIFILPFGIINYVVPARTLFTKKFEWPARFTQFDASNNSFRRIIYLLGMHQWKDKLFFSIFQTNPNYQRNSAHILYTNLNTNQQSPPLKPYLQDTTYPNPFGKQMVVDKCDRMWLFDYRHQIITIINLNKNQIIRRVLITPTYNLDSPLSRVSVDIAGSDCQNAYAYIPHAHTLKILIYSFKRNMYWTTGLPVLHESDDVGNFKFKVMVSYGILNDPTSEDENSNSNRILVLETHLNPCIIVATTHSLRNSRNRRQDFRLRNASNGWPFGWVYNEDNSLAFSITSRGMEIRCWNMLWYPFAASHTISMIGQANVTAEDQIIDLKPDNRWNTLWILTQKCIKPFRCYYYVYTAEIKKLIQNTPCEN